jgi:hypothetical protein
MHYAIMVIIKKRCSIEAGIAHVMKPFGNGREWDWYQIGGRWTGLFDGYKPEEDESNIEICDLCKGTGFRNDLIGKQMREEDPTYTCNACGAYDKENKIWSHGRYGIGRRLKWPTEWKRNAGDIMSVEKLEQKHMDNFYAFCIDGWGWLGGEEYHPEAEDGKKLIKRSRPSLEWIKEKSKDCLAVVVDCHN